MNIKNNNCYKDKRGKIQMVLENCQVGSISIIDSEPGSYRAGHYHKNGEGHWILVTEGIIIMYERPNMSDEIPKRIELYKGDLWFTGEYIDHLMYFPTRTTFHCYSIKPRDSATYESDTVRIQYDLEKVWKDKTQKAPSIKLGEINNFLTSQDVEAYSLHDYTD